MRIVLSSLRVSSSLLVGLQAMSYRSRFSAANSSWWNLTKRHVLSSRNAPLCILRGLNGLWLKCKTAKSSLELCVLSVNALRRCGFGKALLFQSYGESVRQARRLMHKELNPRSVVVHQDLQQQEARRMALRFIDNKSLSITANLRL